MGASAIRLYISEIPFLNLNTATA